MPWLEEHELNVDIVKLNAGQTHLDKPCDTGKGFLVGGLTFETSLSDENLEQLESSCPPWLPPRL